MTGPEEASRSQPLEEQLKAHFQEEREVLEEAARTEPVLPQATVTQLIHSELGTGASGDKPNRLWWFPLLTAAAGLLLWVTLRDGSGSAGEAIDPALEQQAQRDGSPESPGGSSEVIVLGAEDTVLRITELVWNDQDCLVLRWEDAAASSVRTYNVQLKGLSETGDPLSAREEYLLEREWVLSASLSGQLAAEGPIEVRVEALADDGVHVDNRSAPAVLEVPARDSSY